MKATYETSILESLEPGDTVYCILRHVSRSGMQRVISLVIFPSAVPSGYVQGTVEPRFIGHAAADLIGRRYDRNREGIVVNGAGMDMGFELVYSLARSLFRDGYALKSRWL